MATPCDGIKECIDDADENECKFPNWFLPSILSLAAVVLVITCFVSLKKNIGKIISEIMQDIRWRTATQDLNSPNVLNAEKSMKLAHFTENASFYFREINKLLSDELKAHGSEAEAMCCLKVTNIVRKFK